MYGHASPLAKKLMGPSFKELNNAIRKYNEVSMCDFLRKHVIQNPKCGI
jgi:hypothetical protein